MDDRIRADLEALQAKRLSRQEFVRRSVAAGVSLSTIGGLLSASAQAAVSESRAGTPPKTPTGTVTFSNQEPPTANYWDPAAGFGLVDEQVASLVHDTLLRLDEQGRLKPGLATSYKRLDSRRTSIQLRKGVKFHDGTPVTVEDVKASYLRLSDPKSKLAQANTLAPLHINVTGPQSFEIITTKPYGPLEKSLAYVKILPKADIDKPSNFKLRALGAGPYKFGSYQGNTVTITANPDYWGGAPYIQTVKFEFIADVNAAMNALLSGQVQIITRIASEQLAQVKGNKDYYVTKIGPMSQFVELISQAGPLGDVRLRQAVAYAVDRNAIAKGILKGLDPVPQSALSTGSPYYRPVPPKFEYNPDKAKALLKAAGKSDGVKLTFATSNLFPHQPEIDQAIADYLQKVGIDVTITKLEVGAFRTNYNQYDLGLNTLTSFTDDVDFVLSYYQGGIAEAVWHMKDPKVPPMVTAQREAVGAARQKAVTKLAQYLWEQQINLYLAEELWYFIVNSKVQNYHRAPVVGEPLLNKAWINS